MQIQRALILALLASGESIWSVAEKNRIHPFIIAHVHRNRHIRTTGARTNAGRRTHNGRRKLNPDDLRTALAKGKTIKEIFADHPCSRISSIYKACRRWQIPLPKQGNQ